MAGGSPVRSVSSGTERLHFEGHLALADARRDLWISAQGKVLLVEAVHRVEHVTAGGAVDARRIGKIEDGV